MYTGTYSDREAFMLSLKNDLENSVSISMLCPDQKLNIVNQYIWPLQMAPIHQLPGTFLEDIDKLIRSSVKQMLMLPSDTPTSMLYASKNYRGLGLVRASWKAFLQHCNICITLILNENPYVNSMRPLISELNSSCQHLSLPCPVELRKSVTRKLREELRNAEFESWKVMPGRGRGVELYSQVPKANAWIFNKSGLSTSEWVTCLKMNANSAAVRGVPGRSLDGSRCRHGCPETETLAHVQVEEEVFCLATNGSSRRIDIIAYSQTTKKGYIIDPTVRIETGSSQPEDVNQENINIHLPTVDYFKAKYQLEDIEVTGLLIGARGVIPKFFERFRKTFELPQTLTADIITSVMFIVAYDIDGAILHHAVPPRQDGKLGLLLQVLVAPPSSSAQEKTTFGGTESTATAVKDLLRRWQWEILEYPSFSPDMSPCDYDLFAKVKEPLRGNRYNTRDELIHGIGQSIWNINKNGRADGVQCLPNIWQKVINKGATILELRVLYFHYSSGRQHSLKWVKDKRSNVLCTVVQQEEVESSYGSTIVQCLLRGNSRGELVEGRGGLLARFLDTQRTLA
ncbi:hypothetical protein ANN_22354 [Periplaneta americana]|uniref:Uncharacterized protein n=1 Tax=Periplaneta americana TaxID=6978 RepID=A0ABQ8S8E2_PERAM|nr:hypothetical protein ANN_22354 [Periplaneta americana]